MLKELMRKDHVRLIVLLDKFLADKSRESLIVFIGNTRRHIELENEVIYGLTGNLELTKINKKILDDHVSFTKILDAAETVDSIDFVALKGLREDFATHNAYEDKYFYPVIENILSETDLADLADKVKDEVNFAR